MPGISVAAMGAASHTKLSLVGIWSETMIIGGVTLALVGASLCRTIEDALMDDDVDPKTL